MFCRKDRDWAARRNFTVMAGRLGNHAVLLSRIGRDDLGRMALERMDPLPVDTSFVETDAVHETGRVTVYFESGQPHYTIHQPQHGTFLSSLTSGSDSPSGLTRFVSGRWRREAWNRARPFRRLRRRLRQGAFVCLT